MPGIDWTYAEKGPDAVGGGTLPWVSRRALPLNKAEPDAWRW